MQRKASYISKLDEKRPALLPLLILLLSAQQAVMRPSWRSLSAELLLLTVLLFVLNGKNKAIRRFWILLFCFINLFLFGDRMLQLKRLSHFVLPENGCIEIRTESVRARQDREFFTLYGRLSGGAAAGLRVSLSGSLPEGELPGCGEIIRVRVRKERLRPARMPGEFSEAAYHVKKGIFLKLRLKKGPRAAETLGVCSFYRHPLLRLKARALQKGESIGRDFIRFAGPEAGGIAAAMVTGNKYFLSRETEEDFRRLGLSHILVTSGTHVSLCLESFLPFGRIFGGRRKARTLFRLILLLLMSFLCGGAPSILRAALMKAFELRALYRGERKLRDNYLYASVLLLIVLKPRLALDQGLLMSAAAAQAVYLIPPLDRRGLAEGKRYYLKESLRKLFLYLRVQLFLAPFIRRFGGLYSLQEWLGHFLFLPFLNLLLSWSFFFLLFRKLPLLAGWAGLALQSGTRLIFRLFQLLENSRIPGFRITRRRMAWLPFAAVLVYRLYRRIKDGKQGRGAGLRRKKLLLYSFMLSSLLTAAAWLRLFSFQGAAFLDVGQGNAAVIRDGKHVLLIDGGPPGQGRRLEDFLRFTEAESVKLALVTHLDSDHKSGIVELAASAFPLEKIALSETVLDDADYPAFREELDKTGFPEENLIFLKAGDSIRGKHYRMKVLGPSKKYRERNDDSLVLHLSLPGSSVLFTGDAGFAAEKELCEAGAEVSADVLMVSHHGSKDAGSRAFLEAVRPSYALISCGYRNRYGHPHAELLERLEALVNPSCVFRTDLGGSYRIPLFSETGRPLLFSQELYLPRAYAKIIRMEAEHGSPS